jgi:hypothetical protein
MPTRNLRHTAPGPVSLSLNARYAEVDVRATVGDVALVDLVPVDPDEEVAAKLIADTVVRHDGDVFTILLPKVPRITVVGTSSSNRVQHNVFEGDVHISSISGVFGPGLRTAGIKIHVTLPRDSRFDIETDSSGVRASGQYAAARVRSQSGGIHVGIVDGLADLDTQSGAVSVNVAGEARLRTQSGEIVAGYVDEIDAETMNGDIRVGEVVRKAKLETMNGAIEVHSTNSPTVKAETMNGNVTAHGRGIRLKASTMLGRVRHVD